MNDKEMVLTEEQLDFLTEMMNIGAGNAATALSQILRCEANVKIPVVHALSAPNVHSVLGDPSLPVACVKMGMVGDIEGDLLFIVPDEHKRNLIHLARRGAGLGNDECGLPNELNAEPKKRQSSIVNRQSAADLSVLTEIGNILAGVYFTAIHEFCKLHAYHTVPTIGIDMIQSLLDEFLASLSRDTQEIILIENEFIVEEKHIRTLLLMIPSMESLNTLVDSIEQARMAYGPE